MRRQDDLLDLVHTVLSRVFGVVFSGVFLGTRQDVLRKVNLALSVSREGAVEA